MIISVSRRTDIPAFYSQWFMNRIREEYCLTVNPFNRKQISRISLLPEDIDVLIFWTKNAQPLLQNLAELDALGYRYLFHYTINAYPHALEPGVPTLSETLRTITTIVDRIGPERIIWRYDPIVLTHMTDLRYHVRQFHELARAMAGNTQRVMISFVDLYRKTQSNLKALADSEYSLLKPERRELEALASSLSETAHRFRLEIFACAEKEDWSPWGIQSGRCLDPSYLKQTFSFNLNSAKDPYQRPECGCIPSKDIGTYDTCLHGCLYCYAGSLARGERNYAKHQPNSPFLITP